jgi:hypothetical protein
MTSTRTQSSPTSPLALLHELADNWWLVLLRGIGAIAFGILAFLNAELWRSARAAVMSAYGTSRTCHLHRRMSAIGAKADMTRTGRYVG